MSLTLLTSDIWTSSVESLVISAVTGPLTEELNTSIQHYLAVVCQHSFVFQIFLFHSLFQHWGQASLCPESITYLSPPPCRLFFTFAVMGMTAVVEEERFPERAVVVDETLKGFLAFIRRRFVVCVIVFVLRTAAHKAN